jgi:hypothetical protein
MGSPITSSQAAATAGYDFSLLTRKNTDLLQSSNEIKQDILDYNNNEFKDVFTPSFNASSSAINMGRVVGRNASLSDISQQLMDQNTTTKNSYTQAKDTYTRQGEINEWQAQNKLDSLFFLQILFLYFSVVVILLYLRQGGILSSATVNGTIGVLLLVVIGILWNRVSYTNMSRDSRYWNRRYITADPTALSADSQCSPPIISISPSPSSE